MLPSAADDNGSNATRFRSRRPASRTSPLVGIFRDLKRLAERSIRAWRVASTICSGGHDFAYVRATFLDPLPLLLRLRGVPCFVEANGLQFNGIKKHYRSYLAPLNRLIEKQIYLSSDHVFFVGSHGDYWQLRCSHWTNVENGVEDSFIDSFASRRAPSTEVLRLCFLGSLMEHHRPDVLIGAFEQISLAHDFELHLIGGNLQPIAEALHGKVNVVQHGFLQREQLPCILRRIDIGLISGGPEFQSQMKLFDYGAARLAVIAPDIHHLKAWFPQDLLFFCDGNPSSLAKTIEAACKDRERLARMGNQLHDRIRAEFLWSKIFDAKATIIRRRLS